MTLKSTSSLIFGLLLLVAVVLAVFKEVEQPKEEKWFVEQMAEDFYYSDPSFKEKEGEEFWGDLAWFKEWYAQGFLNGYTLGDYYGVESFPPQWEGYKKGREYRSHNPDSLDEVMSSFKYRRVEGLGIWHYGFELNVFDFDGEYPYLIEYMGEGVAPEEFRDSERREMQVYVKGYAGSKDTLTYFTEDYFPRFVSLYVTELKCEQVVSRNAEHSALTILEL